MNAVSVYDFRNDLASYLDEMAESDRPLVISRFGKPVAIVYPYDDKKAEVKADNYFGFLGKGGTGEKFLAKIRRSTREKAYIKALKKSVND
jgi:prevent-host-death family protein